MSIRSIHRVINKIYAEYFANLYVEFQAQLLEGLVMHLEIHNAHELSGLKSCKEICVTSYVVEKIRKALDTFSGSHSKDHEVARCTILTSITSNGGLKESKLQREASRILGVSTKTLRKVALKRATIMLNPNALWVYTGRACRCDSLSMETIALC